MIRLRKTKALGMVFVLSASMFIGQNAYMNVKPVDAATQEGWEYTDGKYFWYEDGERQGYRTNADGTIDESYRGKEIYDPKADAWFWLDNIQEGAKAVSKDVYQESLAGPWGDIEKKDESGKIIKYGKWVRYDAAGNMIKGWDVTEEGTYYFDLQYGTMAKGEAVIDGVTYHFDKDTGVMDDCSISLENHWETIDGKEYWYEGGVRQGFKATYDGKPDPGYRGKEIYDPESEAWYWLDNVLYGAKAVSKDVYQESLAGEWGGTIGIDGQRYGKWVRYDENGHMIKGWSEVGNDTYYFDPQYGTMAKGVVSIEGKNYKFHKESGIFEREATEDDIVENGLSGWVTRDGRKYYYQNGQIVSKVGIDVSSWQGVIDWDKVKEDGIEFAIIRLGHGIGNHKGDVAHDVQFDRNVAECERLGIPYGVYFFSTALNDDEIYQELEIIKEGLKNTNPTLGVFADMEYREGYETAIEGYPYGDSRQIITGWTNYLVNGIREAGYKPGVYADLDMYSSFVDRSQINAEFWIAYYGPWGDEENHNTGNADYNVVRESGFDDNTCWQFRSTGQVDGIDGNADMDIWVKGIDFR